MNTLQSVHTSLQAADIGTRATRKVVWRLLPFLMLCYLFALIDRTNVGMASLQMNKELGIDRVAYGLGASLFFWSYFLAEVPSNLMLEKVGARLWIARIMITWGIVSACMALVRSSASFAAMRLLLGAAEAGFFPGVVLYLTYWLPPDLRGRVFATFAVSIPAASFLGSPLSGLLLRLDGVLGLHGWQWLFIAEGVPPTLLGIACLFVLADRPERARWLAPEEREWLVSTVSVQRGAADKNLSGSAWSLAVNWQFWAMTIACVSASTAGSVLAVWQPQLIKSFGLSYVETGFVNAIPYGLAVGLMVFWGRHSDRSRERRWHTAVALLLICLGAAGTLLTTTFLPTLLMLCSVLIGAYCFKGPFWSLASGWLFPYQAAAGIAAINAVSNLVGGGVMVNVYGYIMQHTGSYSLALAPIACLSIAGAIAILINSARSQNKGAHTA